jgi:hypothetical protein
MREIRSTGFISEKYTDENTIYNTGLMKPGELNSSLTYLFGKDNNMFPLLSATEGQGITKSITKKEMNDTQYIWRTMGRRKLTSKFVRVSEGGAKPGLGIRSYKVVFADAHPIYQYSITAPDGRSTYRLESDYTKVKDGFEYQLMPMTTDVTHYLSAANQVAGLAWVLGAPTIAASKSIGNRSHSRTPGKLTNQFGYHRYSKPIAGNVSSKVVEIEIPLEGGGTTMRWLPFEMKDFEMERKILNEVDLWESEYNRNSDGEITLKDERTGEPIPRGAGVRQMLQTFGYYDTFGSTLPIKKLDNIINLIFGNRDGMSPDNIVMYTGALGKRIFHQSMVEASKVMGSSFVFEMTNSIVKPNATGLTFGNYFTQYKNIDGKVISIVETNLFNKGPKAEQQRENGELVDGHPIYSANMVFLDLGKTSEGDANVQHVYEAGREYIAKIYPGMSTIPPEWGAIAKNIASTTEDIASYEVIDSGGIAITNPTTCFWLEMSI